LGKYSYTSFYKKCKKNVFKKDVKNNKVCFETMVKFKDKLESKNENA
jgi:hypothetical protein